MTDQITETNAALYEVTNGVIVCTWTFAPA